VHVAVTDPAAAEPAIRRLVAAAGFELLALRPIEPSLEDVFVSVLAAQEPSADAR
jgi:ABC-2 type transport system ATP-binding protein